MFDMTYQLAQLNIAKMRYSLDSPTMKDFVDALDPVNQSADTFPGFVWRLIAIEGDEANHVIYGDPRYLVNMSVWESADALKAFVASTLHAPVMARRAEWFEKRSESYSVMWWVKSGHRPTVQEAQEKLEYLRANGPTHDAFHFGKLFAAPDET